MAAAGHPAAAKVAAFALLTLAARVVWRALDWAGLAGGRRAAAEADARADAAEARVAQTAHARVAELEVELDARVAALTAEANDLARRPAAAEAVEPPAAPQAVRLPVRIDAPPPVEAADTEVAYWLAERAEAAPEQPQAVAEQVGAAGPAVEAGQGADAGTMPRGPRWPRNRRAARRRSPGRWTRLGWPPSRSRRPPRPNRPRSRRPRPSRPQGEATQPTEPAASPVEPAAGATAAGLVELARPVEPVADPSQDTPAELARTGGEPAAARIDTPAPVSLHQASPEVVPAEPEAELADRAVAALTDTAVDEPAAAGDPTAHAPAGEPVAAAG